MLKEFIGAAHEAARAVAASNGPRSDDDLTDGTGSGDHLSQPFDWQDE
jgi:hypothetical protein